jgi:cardiolipin synthase
MLTWTLVHYLTEWTIRLVMLFYVPQRRTPAAARSWLLLIFVLPYLGLFLYGLFGRIYLPRKRIELQTRRSKMIRQASQTLAKQFQVEPKLPPTFEQPLALARHLAEFDVYGGNTIELISDYESSIERLVTDIRNANHHVHLLYYIFAPDATGNRVADAVIDATRRGVKCRVLLDGLGSKVGMRKLAPRLVDAGVEVVELLPWRWWRFWQRDRARYDLRNHRKIAVIDARIGYIGSQNLVDPTFKPGIIYRELVARVTGPVVLQLQAVLLTDRYIEVEQPLDDPLYYEAPPAGGTVAAQVVASGPGYPQANNQRLIVSLLHAAQKKVVLTTPYFVPDESLLQAIQSAALRGVEVDLLVSKKADQLLVGLAQRSFYEDLLEAGVRVHQFDGGFLHAKCLSIDDSVAVIGSSNLDIRSFLLNAEVSLIVYDSEVVKALRQIEGRNLAQSRQLALDEWRARPLLTRLSQNIARLVDSLL